MLRMLANLLSVILHPIWMPSLLFGILFTYVPAVAIPFRDGQIWPVLVAIFITTCMLPLLSVWFFKFSGAIENYRMEKGYERLGPFIAVTVFYWVTTFLMAKKLNMNPDAVMVMGTIALLTLIVTVITRFYKISAHSAALTGMLGIILALSYRFPTAELFYPFLLMLILSGLAISSRLYLDAHKGHEVLWGAVLGFSLCFGITFFVM